MRNVTSGLGNRHVKWGQRGEEEDERNKMKCEEEGEEEEEEGEEEGRMRMYQKPVGTSHPVWATGTWNGVSLVRKMARGIRRDVNEKRRGMYQNIGRNVTSGLGNRCVKWGQRGEDDDERNTKRYEGEEEEEEEGKEDEAVPENRAERHIRSGQQARSTESECGGGGRMRGINRRSEGGDVVLKSRPC